MLVMFWFEIFV